DASRNRTCTYRAECGQKSAEASIGELSASRRVGADGHGTRPGRAIDNTIVRGPRARTEVYPHQHLVEELGFSSGSNRVKCVEESPAPRQRIDRVQIFRAPDLRSFS